MTVFVLEDASTLVLEVSSCERTWRPVRCAQTQILNIDLDSVSFRFTTDKACGGVVKEPLCMADTNTVVLLLTQA